ncbi:hypothetical protein TNIN_485281 [Trichonephila inaurata madagascariensis]|uniref:Uncharacterized protein n=1 Tax=Trichonephila inaurata madagascariensis TaxID=2747483 RepID=A0A8X6IGR4_9ARAC|nr:hypothetical protein TNIN_485281 [Trichonephila inaurata madagascariensis]
MWRKVLRDNYRIGQLSNQSPRILDSYNPKVITGNCEFIVCVRSGTHKKTASTSLIDQASLNLVHQAASTSGIGPPSSMNSIDLERIISGITLSK